tara:strand:- start:9 stop:527 length:519 start_codon:yes stop_codon:yes gene_type:complete
LTKIPISDFLSLQQESKYKTVKQSGSRTVDQIRYQKEYLAEIILAVDQRLYTKADLGEVGLTTQKLEHYSQEITTLEATTILNNLGKKRGVEIFKQAEEERQARDLNKRSPDLSEIEIHSGNGSTVSEAANGADGVSKIIDTAAENSIVENSQSNASGLDNTETKTKIIEKI